MNKLFLLLIVPFFLFAKHKHPEKHYQEIWCNKKGGEIEHVLPDKARVDCLTKEYAVEFDFANKWAESIGQALYYGIMTNRKPAIAIIIEHREKDQKYLDRLYKVTEHLWIDVFEVD
jgi:hypothetical protein